MKRVLALAAVAGAMMSAFALPLPAVAAEVPAHCAILPLLKADCRAAIRAAAGDVGSATVAAASVVVVTSGTVAGTIADAVPDSIDNGWRCERRTDGKALFSCSR